MAKITLKLLVDEDAKRVLFAESDRAFADILLSFLVTPLGTAVRQSQGQSDVGAVSAIHRSIESLDVDYLSTKACRDMLLFPVDANRTRCDRLPMQVNDNTFCYYKCPHWEEGNGGQHCFFSTVKGAICACGETMDAVRYPIYSDSGENDDFGVFLTGNHKFMITDDLHISAISLEVIMAKLKSLGVKNFQSLSQSTVEIGIDKVLALFKHALLSKTALTDVFIGKKLKVAKNCDPERFKINDSGKPPHYAMSEMSMTIVFSKLNRKVLFAEANEDVANFYFSFLTFPLGLISNLYNGSSSLGCIDNLWSSAKSLYINGHLRTKEHADMLITPSLAPHHSFQNQIFSKVKGGNIFHQDSSAINMKSNLFSTEEGGGFVKVPLTFMITDGLDIKVMQSGIEGISLMRSLNEPVEIMTFNLNEAEALKLLKASLTSTTPLSKCFQHKEHTVGTMARNTQGFIQNLWQGTQHLAARLIKPGPNLVFNFSSGEDRDSRENPLISFSIDLKLLALVFCSTALLAVLAKESRHRNSRGHIMVLPYKSARGN